MRWEKQLGTAGPGEASGCYSQCMSPPASPNLPSQPFPPHSSNLAPVTALPPASPASPLLGMALGSQPAFLWAPCTGPQEPLGFQGYPQAPPLTSQVGTANWL